MAVMILLALLVVAACDAAAPRAPSEIAVLTLEDASIVHLTSNAFADEEPEWSPDGVLILFDSDRARSNDL